ncbi:hypothetical protein [Streptomyces sp. YS-3]|uniref:hypothetical protein n=1 Tax=Streptomyces sp. YS-3 TaxID=3381352 RepID=UPI003862B547
MTGNWQPFPGSQPYDGEAGAVQHSEEYRSESVRDTDQTAAVPGYPRGPSV